MGEHKHLTMRGMPVGDRPYEKLHQSGAKSLSDAELLAIIIRTGNRSETALALCQRLLAQGGAGAGLSQLTQASLEELILFPGIGRVKAIQLLAAFEIGCRTSGGFRHNDRTQIQTPADAIALVEPEMLALAREEIRIILLDIRNRVIRISRIAEGGLSASVIQPRELFREALRANAASIIMVHNHPSGDASPSRQDIETTHRLGEVGELMGIKIVDHLIVAAGGSVSLRQQGVI
jgi:DNA repair protein RadC